MLEQEHQTLKEIILLARSPAELDVLLDGLLAPPELEDMCKRWRLLQLLEQDVPQRQIARELGVSLGKIARGSRLLKYGPPEFRDLVRRGLKRPPAQ
ncbi:MAG: Trp family transcriptional regulator [Lentisphaeria bacterium]|jgi:TrpR family trp operon transcriptional repressor